MTYSRRLPFVTDNTALDGYVLPLGYVVVDADGFLRVGDGATLGGVQAQVAPDLLSTAPNKGASLIGVEGGGNVQDALEARLKIINVDAYGADPTGAADSYAAFTAAIADMEPGDMLTGNGAYSLSAKVTFDLFRCVWDVRGQIQPFGSYSDFLLDFNAPSADPGGFNNLALMLDFRGLIVDGKLQSRGVRFDQLYLSAVHNLKIFNHYGTALAIDNSMEDSWHGLVIANGLKRTATWKASATAWSNATSYNVGDYVYVGYAAYNAGTAYAVNNFITYGGRSYRCIVASTGFQPDTNPTRWQPVPTEYFRCEIAHSNRDPQSASIYTTNSAVSGDRYWKQVYETEAALEIVNTYGVEVVDNQKFFAPYFRHNDHDVLVRIDNQANERKVTNIEFYGPQFHEIIQAYVDAFPATGATLAHYSTIIQLGRSMRCKFFGGTTRSSEANYVTHFQVGWKNPAKLCENHLITGVDISGEGAGLYGISIMPSQTATLIMASDNEYAFTSGATSPRTCGDTTRLVTYRGAHDIINAATPANFTADRMIRVSDASGTVYYVPAKAATW